MGEDITIKSTPGSTLVYVADRQNMYVSCTVVLFSPLRGIQGLSPLSRPLLSYESRDKFFERKS